MTAIHWLAFGLGVGAGAVGMWKAFPWLRDMLRAARHFLTCPTAARQIQSQVRAALRDAGARRGDPYPRWYIEYVAFREAADL
jgi:hypothetical protein